MPWVIQILCIVLTGLLFEGPDPTLVTIRWGRKPYDEAWSFGTNRNGKRTSKQKVL